MSTGKTKYTRRASSDGWLRVQLTHAQPTQFHGSPIMTKDWFLCEYTAVEMTKEENGRAYFVINDGYTCVGQEASLATENAAKYLSDQGPGSAATVNVRYVGKPSYEVSPYKGRLLQQWGELTVHGVLTAQITLNSFVDSKYTPVPPGHHLILAPDGSHRENGDTRGYAQATPGMVGNDIWFPIGLNGSHTNSSRYIHVGHLSEGCVTTHELPKWTALYEYLISHRVPSSMGKLVGQLEVTK